jgi:phosphoglycerate dehydrogenase-like enzyme
MINRDVLARMKPRAVVINVARGEIIDQAALADALKQGKLKGAGIDVFDREPIDASNPLFDLPNVLLTPHIAGVTGGTFRRRAEAAAENVARTLQGLPPRDQVRGVE